MDYPTIISTLKNAKIYEDVDNIRASIFRYIPAASIMVEFDQQNRAHQYDLWGHCVHTVINLPRNLEDDMLYLAALIHDIGKPDCQYRGNRNGDSNMHYYGHPLRSMEIVRDVVIPNLCAHGVALSEDDKRRLIYYVEYHDDRVSLKSVHLQRHLKIASFLEFQNLMLLQVADAKAHNNIPIIQKRIDICGALSGTYGRDLYRTILEECD